MYKILTPSGLINSNVKGAFAGYKKGKVFGTLECKSGKRMKSVNRVYFLTYQDAISCGYRPCKNCKPIDSRNDNINVPEYQLLTKDTSNDVDEKSKKKIASNRTKSVTVQIEFEIDMKDDWYESLFEEFKTEPELMASLKCLFQDIDVLVSNIPEIYNVKINRNPK